MYSSVDTISNCNHILSVVRFVLLIQRLQVSMGLVFHHVEHQLRLNQLRIVHAPHTTSAYLVDANTS